MEFIKEWSFWMAILQLAGVVGIFLFQWYSHTKIVGNDLHHLAQDLKSIAESQVKLTDKVSKISEDVAFLKGKDISNNKLIEVLDKTLTKVKK